MESCLRSGVANHGAAMNRHGKPEYNLDQLISALADDVNTARDQLLEEDTPYHRRTLARAFFAAVEGHTSALKQLSLRRLEADPRVYSCSPAELAVLKGEDYVLDAKGEPFSRPLRTRAARTFLFSLRMYAKSLFQEYRVDLKDPGWAAFKSALQVRNRITHPQRPEDLEVSDADVKVLARAIDWWNQRYQEGVEESERRLIEVTKKIPKIKKIRKMTSESEILKRVRGKQREQDSR